MSTTTRNRLSDVRPKLSPEAKRLRKRYTRVRRACTNGPAYLTSMRIDHQEFDVSPLTSRKLANWYADQLAIALARLVESERAAGTTGTTAGKESIR